MTDLTSPLMVVLSLCTAAMPLLNSSRMDMQLPARVVMHLPHSDRRSSHSLLKNSQERQNKEGTLPLIILKVNTSSLSTINLYRAA